MLRTTPKLLAMLGVLAVLMAAGPLGAPPAHYRTHSGVLLNDLSATPGDTLTTDTAIFCHRATSTVRDVSVALKRQVFQEYGVGAHPAGSYEVDHLISLELGGANTLANLWPQPASP